MTDGSDGGDGTSSDSTADERDAYLTLAGHGEASHTVRGSEFVGYASPVDTVDAAEAFVAEVREAHPDATHVVPAYRVRADPLREYADDDGEPTNSAGKPALNVLQGREVENAVVAVVRYYGGTNLGVGGLVSAYGRATKAAVAAAGTVTERPHEPLTIVVDYDDSGTVRGILESADLDVEGTYDERVTFDVRVPCADAADLRERIANATSGRAECSTVD